MVARGPKPPAPAGILALVLDRPHKRRQRRIQRRARIAIPRPIIPPRQFPAFLGFPASLPVRCPKNEALSNSTPRPSCA
jgi:hypothetical protein